MQATVQAALALSPQDAVTAAYQSNLQSIEARRYSGFATEALTIAVFEILIAGTLGTLLIRFFAPKLLDRVKRLLHDFATLQCMLLFLQGACSTIWEGDTVVVCSTTAMSCTSSSGCISVLATAFTAWEKQGHHGSFFFFLLSLFVSSFPPFSLLLLPSCRPSLGPQTLNLRATF